jgi:hypothetical protein
MILSVSLTAFGSEPSDLIMNPWYWSGNNSDPVLSAPNLWVRISIYYPPGFVAGWSLLAA